MSKPKNALASEWRVQGDAECGEAAMEDDVRAPISVLARSRVANEVVSIMFQTWWSKSCPGSSCEADAFRVPLAKLSLFHMGR